MGRLERIVLWFVIGILTIAWAFEMTMRQAHSTEWCYASPRQFWVAHPGQHAYYRTIDHRKCWTNEQGRQRRLVWKTPTPQPRLVPGEITRGAVAPVLPPSRFEETFSALPYWDDLPAAKAFFSQQLVMQAWRQWLAESMARAGRVRERWLPYEPRP